MVIGAWVLRGWFSGQFMKVFEGIDRVETNVLGKLEYHERHDDDRFGRISDRLWELKVGLVKKDLNGKPIA